MKRRMCSYQCTLPSLTSPPSWLDTKLCAWAHWPAHTWWNRRRPWRCSVFRALRLATVETCAGRRRWSASTVTGTFPQDNPLSANAETPRRRCPPAVPPPRENFPSACRRRARQTPTHPGSWSQGSPRRGWHGTPLVRCTGWFHSRASRGSPRVGSCQSPPVWCVGTRDRTTAHSQVWHHDAPSSCCG